METQASNVAFSPAKGIDVGKLEKELGAMWAEASGEKTGGALAGTTRACVLNLVVYSTAADDRAQIDALLDEVIERNPCRAIVLVAEREAAETKLDAYVSTRCQLSGKGRKQICGEQVTIEAHGPVVDTVASAVAPLLVPDVPVFLWWKDIPHYDDKLFDRLVGMADRVVIDSASFDHPHHDLLRLARLLEEGRRLNLSDLNWGRLTSWRTLVASFWDVAAYRQHLDMIERVVIEYDQPDIAPGEIAPKALLAAGWIATSLGWELQTATDVGGRDRRFQLSGRDGRAVEVTLRATADVEGRDGMVTSLILSSRDASFYVGLRSEGTKLETGARIGGEHAVGRLLSYEARSEGKRLSGELSFLTRDKVYERSLAFAARMLEAIGT
jgi:glucose-6-phosphate dehydrogenase assembly protein OpcA